jgi:hypothetical protein
MATAVQSVLVGEIGWVAASTLGHFSFRLAAASFARSLSPSQSPKTAATIARWCAASCLSVKLLSDRVKGNAELLYGGRANKTSHAAQIVGRVGVPRLRKLLELGNQSPFWAAFTFRRNIARRGQVFPRAGLRTED